jgi:hypothetical protein
MKPSSFNCALRANKTASQRKVTSVALFGDVAERKHTRQQERAEPNKGDGSAVEIQRITENPAGNPSIGSSFSFRSPLLSSTWATCRHP